MRRRKSPKPMLSNWTARSPLAGTGVSPNALPPAIAARTSVDTSATPTKSDPNVIIIPVIKNFHNGSSKPFDVTGLAWFIITDYTSDTVTGMFVKSSAKEGAICPTPSNPKAGCPVGPYNPDFGFVQLIK